MRQPSETVFVNLPMHLSLFLSRKKAQNCQYVKGAFLTSYLLSPSLSKTSAPTHILSHIPLPIQWLILYTFLYTVSSFWECEAEVEFCSGNAVCTEYIPSAIPAPLSSNSAWPPHLDKSIQGKAWFVVIIHTVLQWLHIVGNGLSLAGSHMLLFCCQSNIYIDIEDMEVRYECVRELST